MKKNIKHQETLTDQIQFLLKQLQLALLKTENNIETMETILDLNKEWVDFWLPLISEIQSKALKFMSGNKFFLTEMDRRRLNAKTVHGKHQEMTQQLSESGRLAIQQTSDEGKTFLLKIDTLQANESEIYVGWAKAISEKALQDEQLKILRSEMEKLQTHLTPTIDDNQLSLLRNEINVFETKVQMIVDFQKQKLDLFKKDIVQQIIQLQNNHSSTLDDVNITTNSNLQATKITKLISIQDQIDILIKQLETSIVTPKENAPTPAPRPMTPGKLQ